MSREGEAPVASVFATTMRNGSLLRLEPVWSAFNGAEWAVWVCLLVYAYSVGGATAWGLMALVQLIPWIFLAPYLRELAVLAEAQAACDAAGDACEVSLAEAIRVFKKVGARYDPEKAVALRARLESLSPSGG